MRNRNRAEQSMRKDDVEYAFLKLPSASADGPGSRSISGLQPENASVF